ncbi:MAG: hypothetical protein COB35_11265 [Gammaproteobacteria bacterium]|nr:MAG: hypothetical protein COB35_11265 [Gammaproteobacteria bacterium]
MIKQHICTAINNEHASLVFDEDYQQWQLTLLTLATEDDLENNNQLENVGDIIDQIVLPVNFCPYCGEKLQNNSKQPATYVYHDFSHW